nr:helix-turn-helix domain protein [uncultured bacterium]
MTQLGERFREAREARGISISEASTATRILPRYLQAIEAGDVASLPGDVYARGFVRNYAQLLGLPAEEMVALYRKERGEPTAPIKIVPAAVPPRTRSCLIPSFFVTFFTVLLLLAAVYVVLNWTGMLTPPQTAEGSTPTAIPATPTTFPTPTDPPPDAIQSPLPPTPSPPQPTIDPLAPTPAPEIPTPDLSATPSAPVVVQAFVANDQTSQGSWFTVNADGVPAFNQLLRSGQSQTWSGQQEIFLNIGDISVVQLLLNGQNVAGFPGAVKGVPRRLTCTASGCN